MTELRPGEEDSHVSFAEALDQASDRAFSRLLSIYDDHAAKFPDDPVAAVERCRFIDYWLIQSNDLEDPTPGELKCTQDLSTRFPDNVGVRLYMFEEKWGQDAIEFADEQLQDPALEWSNKQLAQYNKRRAQLHFHQDEGALAAHYARLATQYDPQIDQTRIIAAHQAAEGHRGQAIATLMSRTDEPQPMHAYNSKAQDLLALEAFDEAVKLLETAESRTGESVDSTLFGRALEGAGQTDRARVRYTESTQDGWSKQEALERLFYVDLESGDMRRAVSSYRALRDLSYGADFFMRHRLALLWTHPTAGWELRDLTGSLGVVLVLLLVVMLASCAVVPIHYVGLVRRERGAKPPSDLPRWTLRTVWTVLVGYLLIEIVGDYVFAYPEIATLFDDFPPINTYSDSTLVRYAVFTTACNLLFVATFVRGGDLRGWFVNRWPVGKTVGRVFLALLIISFFGRLNLAAAEYLGLEHPLQPGMAAGQLAVGEMARAIATQEGTLALMLCFAVAVPITEEVMFRGITLGAFRRHLPNSWANIAQAGLFSLAHGYVAMFPYYALIGWLAGRLTIGSGGLGPAVGLHVAINGAYCLRFAALSLT